MRAIVVMAIGLVACIEGPTGPQGPPGPKGDDGAPAEGEGEGEGEGATVWVDAAGVFVSDGDSPVFTDDDGFRWSLDVETAEIDASPLSGNRQFASDDCTGPAFFDPMVPLVVFVDSSAGDPFVVRPLEVVSSVVEVLSISDGGCFANGGSASVVAEASMVTPDEPVLLFTPPLHQEVR